VEDRPLPMYDCMASGGSVCVCVCTGQLSCSRIRTLVVRGSFGTIYIVYGLYIYNPYNIISPKLIYYCPDAISHCLNHMAAPESDNTECHGHPPFR